METSIKRIAVAATVAAVSLLTACSATTSLPDPSVTSKDASVRGTRICFTNASGLPISAAPGGKVVQSNANYIVDEQGVVDATKERCFAGRNSYEVNTKVTTFTDGPIEEWITEDVAVSVNIDGDYGVLLFTGYNPSIKAPDLSWRESSDPLTSIGKSLNIDEIKNVQAAGHSFEISRRGDSDQYKEFLVNFTK